MINIIFIVCKYLYKLIAQFALYFIISHIPTDFKHFFKFS